MLFAGLMLFMVLTFVRPQDFVPGLRGLPLVAAVMGTVAICWIIKRYASFQRRIVTAPQNALMVAFVAVIVLSTFPLNYFSYTVEVAVDWAKYLLIYYAMIDLIDSRRKLESILWMIVLCMAFTAALGILQYYGMDFTGVGTHLGGRIRGVGIFDTNQLAYAVAFCVPLAAGLLLSARSIYASLGLLLVFPVYFYCIFLTQSRGGLSCLALVLSLLFSAFARQRYLKVGGVILAAVFFVVMLKFSPRLSSTFEYESDKSAMGRIDVWGEALTTLKEHPFLGIGKGQFKEYFGLAAHSSYIEAITELGPAGLFLWLAFFYYSIRNLRAIAASFPRGDGTTYGVIAKSLEVSLYAYLLGSFFSTNTYYITLFILFALVVALQAITGVRRPVRRPYFTVGDIGKIAGVEGVLVLAIVILARKS